MKILLALLLFVSVTHANPLSEILAPMPVQNNGRIKPFDTFCRETILFLTGKYKFNGEKSCDFYLSLIENPEYLTQKIINVRSVKLRKKLNLESPQRHFSINDLRDTSLLEMAEPLMQLENHTEEQKELLEVFHQFWLLQQIYSGDHLAKALDFSFSQTAHGASTDFDPNLKNKLTNFYAAIRNPEQSVLSAKELLQAAQSSPKPDEINRSDSVLRAEVLYHKYNPFLWSAILYILIALILFWQNLKSNIPLKFIYFIFTIPLIIHSLGFALRVWITGFAPVTNMYGTMLWVSFGVSLFSGLLLILYKKASVVSFLLAGSAGLLLLTESMPLVLNPNLDPIVAVLRSNYWLTLHVLTITISYAAFTIAMLLGNAALIRKIFVKNNSHFFKEYSHYAYRMIQLGCFLLTVGIILGGIWADYSWGRFWGWDPKETWALIADLGFLIILHARLIGWIKDFSLLAWSTMAYLLVVMAWYGVNFILASGLHSYGFSSGGALAVIIFVGLQMGLFLVGMLKKDGDPTLT